MSNFIKLVFVVTCVARFGLSSRVLVVFPVPSKSHSIISDSLVKNLLDKGHNVTYISAFTKLRSSEHLKHINISSSEVTDRKPQNLLDTIKNPPLPRQVFEAGIEYVKHVLKHEDVQDILMGQDEYYDAVIAEWYYSGLLSPLAALYNCPLIWYTCEDASWMPLQLIHEQTSPAYAVDLLSSNMASGSNFWSRVYRVWRQAYITARIYYTINYIESPVYHQIYQPLFQKRGFLLPNYDEVLYNGSFLLINSHSVIGQRLSLPSNAKYVGGHHIEEPIKLLPQKLQELLDRSTKGVILLSLGTEISTKSLPQKMKWKLLDVFAELEQTVIWKVDEYMEDLPKNVLTVKWMPQRSILNHKNTVLFINQGGFTSNLEAVYFGIPVISIPFYGDQFVSSDLMVAGGRGLRIDFSEELPLKLKAAIEEMLGNDSYHKSAKKSSDIFHRNLAPLTMELLHWIELVINTRGAPHLHSPAVQMSIFERLHLDIVALLIMFLWFLSKVVKVVQVHMNDDVDDDERKNK